MQLRRTDIKPYREARLLRNKGLCELCQNPIPEGQARLDHLHDDSNPIVRGVICNPCNVCLGKLENGRRYGAYFDVLAFAKGVHGYLTRPSDVLYPPRPVKRGTRKRKVKTGVLVGKPTGQLKVK